MDLHEAQKGGAAPIGSPHEINNLKQQLQDTKKKLDAAEKQVDEKTKAVNELENKLKVHLEKNKLNFYLFQKGVDLYFLVLLSVQNFGNFTYIYFHVTNFETLKHFFAFRFSSQ